MAQHHKAIRYLQATAQRKRDSIVIVRAVEILLATLRTCVDIVRIRNTVDRAGQRYSKVDGLFTTKPRFAEREGIGLVLPAVGLET